MIAIMANAQLAPTTEARLNDHLLEVNAQWRVMDAAPPGGERAVRFENEAQRIATHLHMVAAYARAHTPEGLSAAALSERTTLLQKLDAYADRGVFPQNHVLPYRNPVFLDPPMSISPPRYRDGRRITGSRRMNWHGYNRATRPTSPGTP